MLEEKELQIFRELDDKLYLINNNKTYKYLFSVIDKNINSKSVQDFINKLRSWYFVKYSDDFAQLAIEKRYAEIDHSQEKSMTFEKLMDRLKKIIPREHKYADLYYKQLIIMAGWGLIYSKNTIPEYGYFRAKKMFEEFNNNFRLNLNIKIYDSVMTANYSYDNPEIRALLEQKRMKNEIAVKEKKFSKVRKLFRR